MIDRVPHTNTVMHLLSEFPVVAILGARQTGKTTLARRVAERSSGDVTVFDLEDPRHVARLDDPMLALEPLRGLVVLDEVQRRPDLFPTLRVLADRPCPPARFLILGSASPALLRQSSETLAGRIVFHSLPGFSLREVGDEARDRLWLRGGFPRSFLASSDESSLVWRRSFIRTFVERDLPVLGISTAPATMRRFWAMLAHWHGQTWNGAEFARSFGVSEHTVRRYLDTLVSTFAIHQLTPWRENLAKRQVKSPKVYIADTGLLHSFLNIDSMDALEDHPRVGASYESFALGTVVEALGARPEEQHFWATHQGAELDLFVTRGRVRLGFEFKRTSAPRTTKSMRIALDDLRLDRLDVIHAGDDTFPLAERIRAVAFRDVLREVERL